MKKAFALLSFAAVLCFAVVPCAFAEPGPEVTDFLLRSSLELTVRMGELADSDLYWQVMTGGIQGSEANLLEEINGESYGAPKKAIVIDVPESQMAVLLSQQVPSLDSLPADVYMVLKGKFCTMVAQVLQSTDSTDMLYVSATLSERKPYPQPVGWNGDKIVCLMYDNGFVSMVSYVSHENGLVSAVAGFARADDEKIAEFLEGGLISAPEGFHLDYTSYTDLGKYISR